MFVLTTDQNNIFQSQVMKLVNWMCVEDPFSQVWSQLVIANFPLYIPAIITSSSLFVMLDFFSMV